MKLAGREKVWHKFFALHLPQFLHLHQRIKSLDDILMPHALAWVANEPRVQPPHCECHNALCHVLRKLPTHWTQTGVRIK